MRLSPFHLTDSQELFSSMFSLYVVALEIPTYLQTSATLPHLGVLPLPDGPNSTLFRIVGNGVGQIPLLLESFAGSHSQRESSSSVRSVHIPRDVFTLAPKDKSWS